MNLSLVYIKDAVYMMELPKLRSEVIQNRFERTVTYKGRTDSAMTLPLRGL